MKAAALPVVALASLTLVGCLPTLSRNPLYSPEVANTEIDLSGVWRQNDPVFHSKQKLIITKKEGGGFSILFVGQPLRIGLPSGSTWIANVSRCFDANGLEGADRRPFNSVARSEGRRDCDLPMRRGQDEAGDREIRRCQFNILGRPSSDRDDARVAEVLPRCRRRPVLVRSGSRNVFSRGWARSPWIQGSALTIYIPAACLCASPSPPGAPSACGGPPPAIQQSPLARLPSSPHSQRHTMGTVWIWSRSKSKIRNRIRSRNKRHN